MKENFEVKEQGNNNNTLLSALKLAYHQYKCDLYYVKNKSNIWEGKRYRWGLTHLAIAKHRFYWFVIKG
jgi:hypothetical protein